MNKRVQDNLFFTGVFAACSGFMLSFISYLRICSEACGKAHDYTLCGYSFECYGLIFFPLLLLFHAMGFYRPIMRFLTSLMVASAVGAEIDFILVQKYQIQSFCPICLLIASTIFLMAFVYLTAYILEFKEFLLRNERSEIMKCIKKGLSAVSFMLFGFLFAFVGIAKEDPLKASENSIKEQIILGNPNSTVDVYFFSDWQCPACRSIEPTLERIAPKIMKDAKLNFIDTVVHKDTLNFIPYNVSFLIHDKAKYLELRRALTEISKENSAPSDDEVKNAIKPLGIKLQHLNYSDVSAATAYFDDMVRELNVDATPTMIIIHNGKKPGTKLMGHEITEENVLKAIQSK